MDAASLPQDTYRVQLQQTAASIQAWSGFVADVARVAVDETGDSCRVALTPFAAGTCPVEMIIDRSRPRCTIRIGGQLCESWLLPSLDLVLPLLEAVMEGRVVIQRLSSTATGLPVAINTVIRFKDGRVLTVPGPAWEAVPVAPDSVVSRETHFLPYRKPGSPA